MSTFGNITPQDTELILPTSSPLIKFAILPKKIPIGETHAIISSKKNVEDLIFQITGKSFMEKSL